MPTMIQLRHVPDDLHRKLKARAAMEGLSLSDYLIREVRQIAEKPTMSEMMERLARLTPVHLKTPPAEMVRALRDGRDRDWRIGADGGAARDRRRRARARTSLPRGGDAACAPPSGPGDCPRVTPLLPDRRTAAQSRRAGTRSPERPAVGTPHSRTVCPAHLATAPQSHGLRRRVCGARRSSRITACYTR